MKQKLHTRFGHPTNKIIAVLVIIIVAGIGINFISMSHASSVYVSSEAESGNIADGATIIKDGTASGGEAVQFGGGCTNNGVFAPCVSGSNGGAGASGWGTPVFDDEFTKDTSLNTTKWAPYNNVMANNTNMYASNVSIANGYLNLEASGAAGASGSLIETNPDDEQPGHIGFQYSYGFAEALIYLPASGSEIANWPAWWALGQDWPTDGEMDIMEGLSGSACFHFLYGTSSSDTNATGSCVNGNYSGWHTFGANWQPGSVTYYYDGVDVGQTTTGITSEPMWLVLENSTGQCGPTGSCNGPHLTPSDMLVSYVRVWQN